MKKYQISKDFEINNVDGVSIIYSQDWFIDN